MINLNDIDNLIEKAKNNNIKFIIIDGEKFYFKDFIIFLKDIKNDTINNFNKKSKIKLKQIKDNTI